MFSLQPENQEGKNYMSKTTKFDIIIIGAGIMGLCTAYYALPSTSKILIIDTSTVGNAQSGSGGLTRSYRNDYLDTFYSNLSYKARQLWLELEKSLGITCVVESGVLNIASKKITANINDCYAAKSYNALLETKRKTNLYTSKEQLQKDFPQFNADYGALDQEAGFLYCPTVVEALKQILLKNGVTLLENTSVRKISTTKNVYDVITKDNTFRGKNVVIAAALGTNKILSSLEKCELQLPLSADKPLECQYIFPNDTNGLFNENKLPVFAYLDVGIYGHPIYTGFTKGIKIGFYRPPEYKTLSGQKVRNIQDFISICMPQLKTAKKQNITDVDRCSYDMTPDNDFIVGKLPGYKNIFVATGFCGTGFKFASIIGKRLSSLILKNENKDLERFNPSRFN